MGEVDNKARSIDASVLALVNDANSKSEADAADSSQDPSDSDRRSAEKRVADKLHALKLQNLRIEKYETGDGALAGWKSLQQGAAVAATQNIAHGWEDSQLLQGRFSAEQKRAFQEKFIKDLSSLVRDGTAAPVVPPTSQVADVIKKTLQTDPTLQPDVDSLLQSDFVRNPNADKTSQADFMRFGLQMLQNKTTDTTASGFLGGKVLNSVVDMGGSASTQRDVVSMMLRQPPGGVESMDFFVKEPAVRGLPKGALNASVSTLSRADADKGLVDGFIAIAKDPKLTGQPSDIKDKAFSTIGLGRTSDLRAITDTVLKGLQSSQLPSRPVHVARFFEKMATQIRRGQGDKLNAANLIKHANGSAFPPVPALEANADREHDESGQKTQMENRAKILAYFNKVTGVYKDVEKKIASAKYFEDISSMPNLHEVPSIDTSNLSADDQELVRGKIDQLNRTYKTLKTKQQEGMRALRTSRMPPKQRLAKEAARREKALQPAYFNPNKENQNVPSAPAMLSALPAAHTDVRSYLASLPKNLSQDEKLCLVAEFIASKNQGTSQVATQAPAPVKSNTTSTSRHDKWGVPRPDRELGGMQAHVVKSPSSTKVPAYIGPRLVPDNTDIRHINVLLNLSWKNLSRAETILLSNLGWSQNLWDTKYEKLARWPKAMGQAFALLSKIQKQSVTKLGFDESTWNAYVARLVG